MGHFDEFFFVEKENVRGFFAFIRQKKVKERRCWLGFPREVRILNTKVSVLPARNLPATLHKMET